MNTQAYFDDIQQHIAKELQKARHSIYIVVAWFTDKYLFSTLCDKAKTGIEIELILMDDSINKASGIDYERLARAGGKLWWIPTGSERDRLMHNKFCVMDEEKLLTVRTIG